MEYVVISDENVPTLNAGVVRFNKASPVSILQVNGTYICNHFRGFFTITAETLAQYFKIAPSKYVVERPTHNRCAGNSADPDYIKRKHEEQSQRIKRQKLTRAAHRQKNPLPPNRFNAPAPKVKAEE